MLSEAKHLFWIPCRFDSVLFSSFFVILFLVFFFKGDRGASLRAPPITCLNRKCLAFATRLSPCAKRCFNPQPLHAFYLFVLRTDYVMLHSASSMLI